MKTVPKYIDNDRVVFLSGKICSGKSTFFDRMYTYEYKRIGVSDVVRRLSGELQRSRLSDTANLDSLIAVELSNMIADELLKGSRVVIDGIRQPSIYQALTNELRDRNVLYTSLWLDIDEDILRERFNARRDIKDDMDFDTAIAKDNALGLSALEAIVRADKRSIIIKNQNQDDKTI